MQLDSAELPTEMVDLPALQLLQKVCPELLWYVPLGHCTQTPPEAKVPAPHWPGGVMVIKCETEGSVVTQVSDKDAITFRETVKIGSCSIYNSSMNKWTFTWIGWSGNLTINVSCAHQKLKWVGTFWIVNSIPVICQDVVEYLKSCHDQGSVFCHGHLYEHICASC